LRHYKEAYQSKLVDKNPFSRWQQHGSTTMEQRAAARVDEILAHHKAEPLPESVKRDLRAIVEREQACVETRG
jgi:trimethylamine:corrinoid methyltransferase-like protein